LIYSRCTSLLFMCSTILGVYVFFACAIIDQWFFWTSKFWNHHTSYDKWKALLYRIVLQPKKQKNSVTYRVTLSWAFFSKLIALKWIEFHWHHITTAYHISGFLLYCKARGRICLSIKLRYFNRNRGGKS
jgi:hypothetical protein